MTSAKSPKPPSTRGLVLKISGPGSGKAWSKDRPRPEPVPRVKGPATRLGRNTVVNKPNITATKKHGHYPRRETVIAALLRTPNLRKAAAETGVSPSTIEKWLATPEFYEEYKKAREQVLELSISTVATHVDDAVKTLVRNMSCGRPDSEIRAALGVLHWAGKFLPEQFANTAGAKIAQVAQQQAASGSTIIVVDGTEADYIAALEQVE